MEDVIAPEKSAGAAVAFFSLEMSSDQLATRILSEQSGIRSENLRMGKISQQDFRNLARAQEAKAIFNLNPRTAEEFKEYAAQFEKFLTDERVAHRKPQTKNKRNGN